VPRLVARLNAQRVRPSRGGYTADELDRILPRAEDLVDRARFYDSACAAIERAAQASQTPALASVPSAKRSGAPSRSIRSGHMNPRSKAQGCPHDFRDTVVSDVD